MNIKSLGSQFLKIRINDNDIKEGMVGVMGDANARNFKVNILSEKNEILADTEVSLKLFIKQGDSLIVTAGQYNDDGTYVVDIPNEVFMEEQTLECQMMIEKDGERLFSTIFHKKVERGLLGTVRDGKTTSIDLLKAMEFGDKYEEKLREMIDLAAEKNNLIINTSNEKLNEYNSNSLEKINLYDENHRNGLNVYNQNAVEKIKEYNQNSINKISEFNANSDNKVVTYNQNAESKENNLKDIQSDVIEKQTNINQTAEIIDNIKSDFDSKKSDFDNKYDGVIDIVQAENSRVQAENLRQQHDERIQKLLTEGLNAELGDYAKRTDLDKLNENISKDIEKKIDVEMLVFENSEKEDCIGIFKIIDGNPVIEVVKVGE